MIPHIVWISSSEYCVSSHSFLIWSTTVTWFVFHIIGISFRILLCDSILDNISHLSVFFRSRHRSGTIVLYNFSLDETFGALFFDEASKSHSSWLCPYFLYKPLQSALHSGQLHCLHLRKGFYLNKPHILTHLSFLSVLAQNIDIKCHIFLENIVIVFNWFCLYSCQ